MALVRREPLRVRNPDIAEVFEDIASLLEIKGEVFTVRAYRRASQTIRDLPVELDRMVAEGSDLREIPGIGEVKKQRMSNQSQKS
jgi:DNA polymerase (family 10)